MTPILRVVLTRGPSGRAPYKAYVEMDGERGSNLLDRHRYVRLDSAQLEARRVLNDKIPGVRIEWLENPEPTGDLNPE